MTCGVVTLPMLASQDIASKLKEHWLAQNQQCIMAPSIKQETIYDDKLDDSLTSLNWLHNIKIMKIGQPTPPSSPPPLSFTNQHPENLPTYIQNQQLKLMNWSDDIETHDFKPLISRTNSVPDQIDYKANGNVKPPYSYATLIWMAMKETRKSKITLSAIYKWIMGNFKYYRTADPSWQNSIRHNLSLNKCFQKVARRKDEPGKGGFWRIDPVHAELLEKGILKKRRANSLPEIFTPPLKCIKLEPEDSSESEDEVFEVITPEPVKSKKHKSKSRKSKSKHSKHSKRVSRSVTHDDSSTSEDDNLPSSVLDDNFQWDSIFDSEIVVDGVRVKAEAILDPSGEVQILPVLDSPPHSEGNEDFSTIFLQDVPLDLSIKGTHIPKPLWFEGQNRTNEHGEIIMGAEESMEDLFGMTDLPPSPANSLNGHSSHPWAESRGQFDDFYFEEFLNFGASGYFQGTAIPWQQATQTVIIEK